MWTFGRRVGAGFLLSFALLAVVGTISYRSLNQLSVAAEGRGHAYRVLAAIQDLFGWLKDAETGQRGYVITGEAIFLEPYETARGEIPKSLRELRDLVVGSVEHQRRLDEAEPLIAAKMSELARTIDMRRAQGFEATEKAVASGEGKRYMDDLRKTFDGIESDQRSVLAKRAEEVEAVTKSAKGTILAGTLICLLFVVSAAILITRSLATQIGSAVHHVQSSSAELQATASQQASGAKESATAMNEISMTMSELLVTSRQIAESAERVAQIAGQTVSSARSGSATVEQGHESIGAIRRQVDVIVNHMLDLGKKSQQVGAVLDIVSELAEQTNILAINATIEAAGAGDAGRRFAVVADEIRKLADRVAGSTKEIRGLIEDVRSAVNTTVMTTETGSKAVDLGAKQFVEVASSFKQITGLVATTTEASKEIELSTKQQATAVEQVNIAITNVAQATKETEASTGQTLETASQLAGLSRELLRLVQPRVTA